jgi:proteasome assembly chaperone (PAC2) family protein
MEKVIAKKKTKAKDKNPKIILPSGLTETDKLKIKVEELEYKLKALEEFVAKIYENSGKVIKQDDTSKEETGIKYGE